VSEDRYAPKGMVWVCLCCGKISPNDRHNDDHLATRGWDVSCSLNASLIELDRIEFDEYGRAIKIN